MEDCVEEGGDSRTRWRTEKDGVIKGIDLRYKTDDELSCRGNKCAMVKDDRGRRKSVEVFRGRTIRMEGCGVWRMKVAGSVLK